MMLSMIWVLSFYGRRRSCLRLCAASAVPRPALLWRAMALGFASFLSDLSFSLFFVLFNRAMSTYGGPIALSALGVFLGWDSLLFLPVMGIADAVQAIFGYNWGARLQTRVLETLKWALTLSAGYFAGGAVLRGCDEDQQGERGCYPGCPASREDAQGTLKPPADVSQPQVADRKSVV